MTPAEPPTTSLFEGLSLADDAAMSEIRRRYGPRVWRIARRGLHARSTFMSEAAFLAWVRRIVEHRILAAAKPRAFRRRGPSAPRPVCEEGDDSVARALSDLAPDDRALLITRAILNVPWDAIARSCGDTQAPLQSRYAQLRRRLAAILKRCALPDTSALDAARDTTSWT